MGGNPWQCDCELEWFKRVNQLAVEGTFPRVLDLDTVLCTVHGANESLQQMTRMRTEEFLCQYDAHCIPECYCCDFLACDCRMQCPDGKSCFFNYAYLSYNLSYLLLVFNDMEAFFVSFFTFKNHN